MSCTYSDVVMSAGCLASCKMSVLQTCLWCTCAADHATIECVEVSGSSAGPPPSGLPTSSVHTTSANPPNPVGGASPRGHKRLWSDAKPATTQSRLCFAPLQPAKPAKRWAKKGDADHQEWCASAFDVIENVIDEDGRPMRIRVQCLLCKRRNVTKE